MTEPAYRIESVDKALRLLHMFRDKPRWTVSEVGEALGVAPSTAHRLLAMLQWHEFAYQEPGSKAYAAGRALLAIGLAALSELSVRDVARAEIEALSAELGETVHLIVLQGARTLIVDAVEGDQVVRVGARIGGSAPPNCVSAGKVLLSRMTDRQVAALIGPDPLPRRTSRSIGTLAELTADLARVRGRGYATNFDEHEFGATGISVPIPVPPGVTPAAITVNAPSARVPDEQIPVIVAAAAATAARIAAKVDPAQPAAAPDPPRSSPARPSGRAGRGARREPSLRAPACATATRPSTCTRPTRGARSTSATRTRCST
jgi:DNA-binding IclR family transcriptional regulator